MRCIESLLVTAFSFAIIAMRDDACTECTWKSLYTEDSLPEMNPQKRDRYTAIVKMMLTTLTHEVDLLDWSMSRAPDCQSLRYHICASCILGYSAVAGSYVSAKSNNKNVWNKAPRRRPKKKKKKIKEVENNKNENKSHGQQKECGLIQCSQKQHEKILLDTKKKTKAKENLFWARWASHQPN